MTERLSGKVAIVTGAASGIGRAIAERLADEGAAVLIADRDADGGAAVAAGLVAAGRRAGFLQADVTQFEACAAMVRGAVGRWGGLDILVNNAGIGAAAPVALMEEPVWDRVIEVNLKGVYLGSRAAFPALQARGGGSILNIASLAAVCAAPGFGAYAASKAAVVQFTRVLALEGAPAGIRANALCPIWVDTPLVRRYLETLPDPPAEARAMAARIPLGRFATVTDVDAAALYLTSDEAAFLTGIALPVDGGYSCQ